MTARSGLPSESEYISETDDGRCEIGDDCTVFFPECHSPHLAGYSLMSQYWVNCGDIGQNNASCACFILGCYLLSFQLNHRIFSFLNSRFRSHVWRSGSQGSSTSTVLPGNSLVREHAQEFANLDSDEAWESSYACANCTPKSNSFLSSFTKAQDIGLNSCSNISADHGTRWLIL
jgi:hypothetical protein